MVANVPPPVPAPVLVNETTGQAIGGRLQRWAKGFTLPSGGTVKVRLGRAPTPSQEPAAMVYGATAADDVLVIDPSFYSGALENRIEGRHTVLHELAHKYDRRILSDDTRARFETIMGDTRPWRTSPNSPHEQFAEALAMYLAGERGSGAYDYTPSRAQAKKVRALFRGL